jgi:hypothetical protein
LGTASAANSALIVTPDQFESRNVVLVSYIHVLSAAFLMGLAAAAPMGPVNMLALRRGVIGGWRHTLACGIGNFGERLLNKFAGCGFTLTQLQGQGA